MTATTLTLMKDARGAFWGADQRTIDACAALPVNQPIEFRLARDRSLPQHRLFWALLDHVAKASQFETAERLLVALKLRLGRYDLMAMPGGKVVVPVPHSISFAKMPQHEFQKFFDDAVRLICAEVIPGTDSAELIATVEAMLQ